jgi:hypothetical protein
VGIIFYSFCPYSAATHAQCGHLRLVGGSPAKKNFMKGRRALRTLQASTGQKHRASGCLNFYL